ncbi:MAG: hypothetical protein WD069_12115 [Planctomycetales bacterium]
MEFSLQAEDGLAGSVREGAAELREEAGAAAGDVSAFAARTKAAFVEQFGDELAAFDRRMEDLERRGAELTGRAKAEWDEQMAKLRAERAEAAREFEELKRDTSEGWEQTKDGLAKTWDRVRRAYDAAEDQLTRETNDEPDQ